MGLTAAEQEDVCLQRGRIGEKRQAGNAGCPLSPRIMVEVSLSREKTLVPATGGQGRLVVADLSPIRSPQPDQWHGMPGPVVLQHGQWRMGANRLPRHRLLVLSVSLPGTMVVPHGLRGTPLAMPKGCGWEMQRGPQIQARPYPARQLPQVLLTQDGKRDPAQGPLQHPVSVRLQVGLLSKAAQGSTWSNFHAGIYLVSADRTGPGQESLLGHPWHEGVGEELPSLTVTKLLFSSLMMSPTSTLSHKSSFKLEENPSYKSTREKGIP